VCVVIVYVPYLWIGFFGRQVQDKTSRPKIQGEGEAKKLLLLSYLLQNSYTGKQLPLVSADDQLKKIQETPLRVLSTNPARNKPQP